VKRRREALPHDAAGPLAFVDCHRRLVASSPRRLAASPQR
jgi:hypothetical protein